MHQTGNNFDRIDSKHFCRYTYSERIGGLRMRKHGYEKI